MTFYSVTGLEECIYLWRKLESGFDVKDPIDYIIESVFIFIVFM